MTLHLIHIPNVDMRGLYRWASDCGLLRGNRTPIDEGFLLHHLLGKIFAQGDFRPFRLFLPRRGSRGTLYAYSPKDADEMASSAKDVIPPDCMQVINLDQMRSKEMPSEFPVGKKLGFDIQVRPVRRTSKEVYDKRARIVIEPKSEMDAYHLTLLRADAKIASGGGGDESVKGASRESVYSKWLGEKFGGAAEIPDCMMKHFRRTRITRGKKGFEGPDAVFHGNLVIQDSAKFMELLANGLGRHKSYGYGMILLRPPSRK